MKKFYAFLASALISVSAFASIDQVPSDEILADYYEQGNVCMCFFVPADMACNDIVVTGSFNGWSSTIADCVPVEAVEGYDGWYVASFEPEDEPSEADGICAKPVMTDVDGNFNWAYQVGAATVIRGGVQVVQGAYAGEIDLKHYGTDAPNVFMVDAWKANPCTAIYHNYTIQVISSGCNGLAVPFLIGGMNNWTAAEMQIDQAKTLEYEVPVYYANFKAAEETEYQLLSGLRDPNTGLIDSTAKPGWNDDSYLQVLVDGVWSRYEPGNSKTGAEALIVYDLREDTMRWARCDDSPLQHVVMWVNLPALNRPEAVEIIGGFDAWEGTAMELLETGWFFVELDAKESMFFKFRGAGSWDQELELYNTEDDTWAKIGDGQLTFGQLWVEDSYKSDPCMSIELDFSDPELARWSVQEEGIENVVLTEKAQKVMVDGVMYIIRDNKMFNVQGTQVR